MCVVVGCSQFLALAPKAFYTGGVVPFIDSVRTVTVGELIFTYLKKNVGRVNVNFF